MYHRLKYSTWTSKTFRGKHQGKPSGPRARQRVLRYDNKCTIYKRKELQKLDFNKIKFYFLKDHV
jgi:hypothetical protein